MMRRAVRRGGAWLLSAALLAGCGRDDVEVAEPGGSRPVEAIATLNTHLINNDLAAFARAALPPDLYAQLGEAWQAGHTRWPLDEFPFSSHYPDILAALSAAHAHTELMQVFDQQLAGAERDLRQTALLMSAFMAQFIQHQGHDLYIEHERAHYSQLITAAGRWASSAPLADRTRAAQALDILIPAARKADLTSDAAFAEAGMDGSLHRLAPVMAAFKQALTLYGLALDPSLNEAKLQLRSRNGDSAEVQMRYRLGADEISADIEVQQIDGRWYVSDFVRHATDALAPLADAAPTGSDTF